MFISNCAEEWRALRTYRELGHLEQSLVIHDSANDDGNALVVGDFGHVLGNGAQRYRRTVDARHEQTFQHDFVEMRPGAPCQVTVQLWASQQPVDMSIVIITIVLQIETNGRTTYLNQQQQIHILGLGRSSLGLMPAPVIDVDTLRNKITVLSVPVGRERARIETDEKYLPFSKFAASRTRRYNNIVQTTFEKDARRTRGVVGG